MSIKILATLAYVICVAAVGAVGGGCAKKQTEVRAVTSDDETRVTYSENSELLTEFVARSEGELLSAKGVGAIPPGYKNDSVGRSLARDAALVGAYDALYQKFGEVKITSEITVLNAAVNSQRKLELQGIVKGAEIIEDRFDEEQEAYIISLSLEQKKLVEVVKRWSGRDPKF